METIMRLCLLLLFTMACDCYMEGMVCHVTTDIEEVKKAMDECEENTSRPPTKKQETTTPYDWAVNNFATRLVTVVTRIGYSITSVENWYNYNYDGQNKIGDGGNDMYDDGNQIVVLENNIEVLGVNYSVSYNFPSFEFSSSTAYPFIALLWIDNAYEENVCYSIKVSSETGADNVGEYSILQGNVSDELSSGQYHVFQVHGAGDPSICEVYFVISSQEVLNSTGIFDFSVEQFSNNTETLENSVVLNGNPDRVMMGYTLFSKINGNEFTNSEIEQYLRVLMHALADDDLTTRNFAATLTSAAYGISQSITSVKNWYNYEYDGNNSISDGGNDMYDGGNQIVVVKNNSSHYEVLYNVEYSSPSYDLSCIATYPFIALLWITNPSEEKSSYLIQVSSDIGADNYGDYSILQGNVSDELSSGQYYVFQVHDAGDPSICEVYFVISSQEVLNSTGTFDFSVNKFSTNTNTLENSVILNGTPVRVVMGYTLFSKKDKTAFTRSEVEQYLTMLMQSFANINEDFK